MDFLEIAAVVFIGLFISLIAYTSYDVIREYVRYKKEARETVEMRISRLFQELEEAVRLLGDIQNEIKARHNLALKLQEDIRTYKQIVELKQPEVEAVAQLLRGELRKERRHSFWRDFSMKLVFYVLGVFTTLALSRLF